MGERLLGGRICRTIPDVSSNPEAYLKKTTVVVGAGYSAITTINGLRELAAAAGDDAGVKVVWATRRGAGTGGGTGGDAGGDAAALYERIDNDPLPQRDRYG